MIKKTFSRRRGASFPSCFRPSPSSPTTTPSTTTTTTTTTNLTTSLYHTPIGIFALTWSHTLLSRSLHLHLLPHLPHLPSTSHTLTFHPLLFWSKHGSRPLPLPSGPSATLSWDLSRAHFGPGPEPESNFSVSVHLDSQILLLVSDLKPGPGPDHQALVVRREHVQGARLHTTKAQLGGKMRSITIECEHIDPDPKLVIRVDDKKVLQVKHLKWKFRGSDRIDVDGYPITISWDVYNWLFDDCDKGEGFALFTFRFEHDREDQIGGERVLVTEEVPAERGWRKRKGLVAKAARSSALSSSVSASSASSACGSVLEWESVEETELKGPTGFSLLVYAWKS